jgi:hypothetical protein
MILYYFEVYCVTLLTSCSTATTHVTLYILQYACIPMHNVAVVAVLESFHNATYTVSRFLLAVVILFVCNDSYTCNSYTFDSCTNTVSQRTESRFSVEKRYTSTTGTILHKHYSYICDSCTSAIMHVTVIETQLCIDQI